MQRDASSKFLGSEVEDTVTLAYEEYLVVDDGHSITETDKFGPISAILEGLLLGAGQNVDLSA